MDPFKKKRQRRSYSCGSCKLLKIKCDLQIPCSSCIKFKRVDKCLLNPPRPPSLEEMNKIQQRRNRSINKRMNRLSSVDESDDDDEGELSKDDIAYNHIHHGPIYPDNNNSQIIPNNDPHLNTSPESNSYQYPKLPSMPLPQYFSQYPVNTGILQSRYTYAVNNMLPSLPTPIYQHGQAYPPINTLPQATHQNHLPLTPSFQPGSVEMNSYSPDLNMTPDTNVTPDINVTPDLSCVEHQLLKDEEVIIEISAVDLRRIKSLLPSSFATFDKLHYYYLKSENERIIELTDHKSLRDRLLHVYNKILSIDDQDLSKSFSFSIVELRSISLFFLISSSGLLFEKDGLKNFLIERSMFSTREDVIKDWVKISKFLKSKVLKYETITDILYLMVFYFMIKNYYTYENMIVENYLEYNNLLSYVVLNNRFMEIIEDPEKDEDPKSTSPTAQSTRATTVSQKTDFQYPKTREFEILAKFWIQIRLVEIEFSFFQFKGSSLSSNQLKNTIVPDKKLVDSLHGSVTLDNKARFTKYFIDIMPLYYRRNCPPNSVKEVIRSYLNLYGNVLALSLSRFQDIEFEIKQNPLFIVGTKHTDLLLNNQAGINLFVRWLSFIRIESSYFPSLRYLSYLTTIMNSYNYFNFLDDLVEQASGGQRGILDIVVENYSFNYIKPLYYGLLYQATLLYVMKNTLDNHRKFKVNLPWIYDTVRDRFEITYFKFLNNRSLKENLNIVKHFKYTLELIGEIYEDTKRPRSKFEDYNQLANRLENVVSNTSWDILLNYFFGSKDNLVRYVEKTFDLFQYLKVETVDDSTEVIPVTSTTNFSDEVIQDTTKLFTGYVFDSDTVCDYIRTVVGPKLSEELP